jgi:hypothetical protein
VIRRCLSVISCAALLMWPVLSSGTPGRLNREGCHNSKKAGYHCHRAQTAGATEHSHTTHAASAASASSSAAKTEGK